MNIRFLALLVYFTITLWAYRRSPGGAGSIGIGDRLGTVGKRQPRDFGTCDPGYCSLQRRAGKLLKLLTPRPGSSKKLTPSKKQSVPPKKRVPPKTPVESKNAVPSKNASPQRPVSSQRPTSLRKPLSSRRTTLSQTPTSSKPGSPSPVTATSSTARASTGSTKSFARKKCSAKTCSGLGCVLSKKPKQLSRRTFEVPKRSNIDKWMVKETDAAKEKIVWQSRSGDMNTATFRELGSEPITLPVEGLEGCTSLVIVSLKAVYFTHWWESISFAPDKQWLKKGEDTQGIFKRTVLDAMEHGEQRDGKESHAPLHPSMFADGHAKAFLIRPNEAFRKNLQAAYDKKWRDAMDYVSKKIPGLEWGEPHVYERDQEDTEETALGKVVFKYDPAHYGKKKAILVTERTVRYNEEW